MTREGDINVTFNGRRPREHIMMIIFLSFYILVRHSDIHQAERLEEEIARFFRRRTRPGTLHLHRRTIVITSSLYKKEFYVYRTWED